MRFRWGDCELDREARTLTRAGDAIRVQPLVLDLLLLLLQHRSRVIAHEVLERALWGEVRVTDASLRRLLKEARRALGEDGESQTQIQTVRGRGIRFAAPVTVEGGWDTSFVGRGDLVDALEETLEGALTGIGSVTLLYGPAGIGKTRTLVEFIARAEARDMRVLRGSGRAGAEGDAFHPWLEAGAELGIDELLRGPSSGGATAARARDADARRYAQFREVAHMLTRHASARPLFIALDDLQFADADSLALLRYLAPSLRSTRVWLLGSIRSSSLAASQGRMRELAALGAETSSQVFALRGLGADELRTIVQNRLHLEVGAPAAALLSERTEGNPLFALEIGRSVQSDGGSLAGGALPGLEAELATRIESLLERRRSALSAEAQSLLAAASAIGIEFDPWLVQAAENCSARALKRALDEATAAGLLEPALEARRRFAHPLFAEALYGELVSRPSEAAAQHLRIAEALERRGCADPFVLARHFTASRPLVVAERALQHARGAAEAAERQSALADAELWYQRALALADECGRPARELVGLLLELGEVVVATSGITEARPLLERAARLAAASDDGPLLARAALAYAHRPFALAAQEPVLRWLRAANAAPDIDPSLRARVVSRLGAELAYAGGEHAAEAARCLERGLELAVRHGDPFTLGRVLVDQTSLRFSAPDTRGWLSLMDEIVSSARAGRDPEIEFRGLVGAVAGHLELGDRAAARQALQRCQNLASEHAAIYAVSVTRGVEATFAMLEGRLADARAAIDASDACSGGRGLAAQIVGQRFLLALHDGRLDDPMPMLERTRAQYPALLLATAATALAYAMSGGVDAARVALSAVIEGLPALRYDWNRLPALVVAAEVAFRAHVPDAAAALEPELAPYVQLGAVNSNASGYFGSVAQALGFLAAARGRKSEALEFLQRALRAHETLGAAAWCERSTRAIEEVRRVVSPVRLVSSLGRGTRS